MMKNYFLYLLKSSKWMITILTIVGIILYIPSLVSSGINPNTNMLYDTQLGVIAFYLAAACTLVPIYEFTYMKRKRNLDSMYSFPIRRHHIAILKYIIGFIEIVIPYTICYFLGFLVVASRSLDYQLIYYLSFYGVSLIIGLILYSYYTFVYTRANTIIDGIVLMVLYSFVFTVIFSVIWTVFDKNITILENGITYVILVEMTAMHNSLLMGYAVDSLKIGPYIFWLVIGIASVFGLIFTTFTDKAERAEQISESWFAYKVLIPLFIICLMITTVDTWSDASNLALIGSYGAAGLVGYVIYQRKFKMEGKYWLFLAGSILIGIILGTII